MSAKMVSRSFQKNCVAPNLPCVVQMYGSESSVKPMLDVGDSALETSFCQFVETKMPPRLPGTVRLFERNGGEYFSAHGEDALLIATTVYKTTNVLKFLGATATKKGLPSLTLSLTLAKGFLREALTAKQMRVEIWEPESGGGGSGRHVSTRWKLGREASPGNLQQLEDLLFAQADNLSAPMIMSVKLVAREGQRRVGVAFADASERVLGVSEYLEDEMFSNTEALIIQLGVKECLVAAKRSSSKQATAQQGESSKPAPDDHDMQKLLALVDRCGVVVTEVAPSHFASTTVEQDARRLLHDSVSLSPMTEFDLPVAVASLGAIISYLNLPADHAGKWKLRHHDLSRFMRLDASALRALNLMPNPLELGGNKNMSVYGLLNHCKTAQGQRLLAMWLKQPLVNLHEIEQRQDMVEAFAQDGETRRTMQMECLRPMPDFGRLTKRFARKLASLEDVVRVYQAVAKLPKMVALLEHMQSDLLERNYVQPLRQHDEALLQYRNMVEETIDLDELANHNFVLQSTFDPQLADIKRRLIGVMDGLDAEHQAVAAALKLDGDKKLHLERHQVYGYSLRVTKAEASKIKGSKYIELAVQKSGSIFTTRALKALSEEHNDLTRLYEKTQRGLVQEVVAIAASYTPILELLDALVASLDVLVSFAHVSENAPIAYVKPKLSEMGSGDLVVRQARHPCLEVQDEVNFIPNDHVMVKGEGEFQILTGPNMGGKSTYIRQIGVIALMAQVGCFVPAEEARLPVFDSVLARVGAGDSQLKGVSTFMAEMLETASILRSATANSLVIIDELGRGTSTYDGFGLAWAISEHIATEIHCFCLFATHFHELTTLTTSLPHVKNYHVTAHVTASAGASSGQDRDITLLYRVEEGFSDQSFGIHVAELANFPDSVVRLAKRKAEELEDFGDGSDDVFAGISQEETDKGTAIVEQFMREWKEKTSGGDEDEQMARLRETVEAYRERFEGNKWVTTLLKSF